MEELKNAIVKSFNKMADSGKIQEIIDKKLEATVTSVLDDCLRDWSDFGKALKEVVKTNLNINMDDLKIAGYNDLILKIIQQKIDSNISAISTEQIEKQMAELLKNPPTEIKLSELIADFIEYNCDEDNPYENPEEITFIYENKHYPYVYFDKEPNQEKYRCEFRFGISDEKMFNCKIDGEELDKSLFHGAMFNFEKKLFHMYAAGTKIIMDVDDVETYYPSPD